MTSEAAINEILELSRQLLSRLERLSADKASETLTELDTEEIGFLEQQRALKLQALFQDYSSDLLIQHTEKLNQLLQLDNDLVVLAKESRDNLKELMRTFKKNQKATAAYKANR